MSSLVDYYFPRVQTGIAFPFLMKTVDKNLHLTNELFSAIFVELIRMQILLQGFKSLGVPFNFSLNYVEEERFTFFKDKHIVSKNYAIFIESMQSPKAREAVIAVLSSDETNFLICVLYVGNKTVTITTGTL